MKVDPAGLASAAQRMTASLGQLPSGEQVHPPLAADSASQGAALRLTAGASTLAALIGELAAGLATTAGVLSGIGAGFEGIEAANTVNLRTLRGNADSAPFTGFAPPPAHSPDVRPPLSPRAEVMGEMISRATHSGDPAGGEGFVRGWSRVADAVDEAADVVIRVVDGLPETWNSEVATRVVRAHLLTYRRALQQTGARARTLASQAGQHAGDLVQARKDIPSPDEFDKVNEQIRQTFRANQATGGKYAIRLAALNAQKTDLNGKAVQGHGSYHLATEKTTAPDPRDDTALPMDDPGAVPAADADRDTAAVGDPGAAGDVLNGPDPAAGSPESAGQLAGMLPSLIPTVLGAVGGLAGGLLSTVTKAPEAAVQAATQAAGAAVQGLSGAMNPNADTPGVGNPTSDSAGDPSLDNLGGAGGGGETTPAAGDGAPTPAVVPTTGPTPTAPTMPTGALPEPVQGTIAGGAMMPMGAMMPPGGGPGGAQQQKPQRAHRVEVPRTPHSEAVTGKINEDRIARAATTEGSGPEPPHDDPPSSPPKGVQPLVRRITMAPPKDDQA
jgi:hypothetical protein